VANYSCILANFLGPPYKTGELLRLLTWLPKRFMRSPVHVSHIAVSCQTGQMPIRQLATVPFARVRMIFGDGGLDDSGRQTVFSSPSL
jgi:hypothetical protein